MGWVGVAEAVTYSDSGGHGSGGAGQGFAGVVVDEVEDLDLGPRASGALGVGQVPVGDVGPPAFVGLFGLEADVAVARTFARLRGDEPALAQHLVDGGDRRVVPVSVSRW